MPSVRGPERRAAAGLLIATGTITGALVGLLLAFIASPLPDAATAAVIPLVWAGLVLDALALLVGRPSPPGSGRQVPQEWSRLLDPQVVAVLYGGRLGVGPLTILSTWTWWSVTLAAAIIGPWTSVAAGACFGFVRLLSTVLASLLSGATTASASARQIDDAIDATFDGTPQHARWFARLRARRKPNWIMLNGAGALVLLSALVAGCGGPALTAEPQTPNPHSDRSETRADAGSWHANLDPTVHRGPGADGEPSSGPEVEPSLITPAELEDVVRTAEDKNLVPGPSGSEAVTDRSPSSGATVDNTGASVTIDDTVSGDPDSLSKVLMGHIAGFEPVEDPTADRFLDITAASEIQPDPTEEIALLETRGFEGGWTRAFRNGTNDVAVTSVYHFKNQAEAEFYLEDGLITIGGYGGKFFDIESLPGARGFVQQFTDDEDGEELVSLGAAFQTGPRWYLVYFVGSAETVTPEVLVPAVAAQRVAAGLA